MKILTEIVRWAELLLVIILFILMIPVFLYFRIYIAISDYQRQKEQIKLDNWYKGL